MLWLTPVGSFAAACPPVGAAGFGAALWAGALCAGALCAGAAACFFAPTALWAFGLDACVGAGAGFVTGRVGAVTVSLPPIPLPTPSVSLPGLAEPDGGTD